MTIKPYDSSSSIPSGFIEIYTGSFPPEERRGWLTEADAEDFIRSHPQMRCVLAFDDSDGTLAGFLTYWRLGCATYYGEHLAIRPDLRNRGLGAQLIAWLKSESADRVLLEVELPDGGGMASRRIAMYQRHGFVPHPEIDYVQPPYSPEKEGVRLMIMSSPKVNPAPLLPELCRCVYGVDGLTTDGTRGVC